MPFDPTSMIASLTTYFAKKLYDEKDISKWSDLLRLPGKKSPKDALEQRFKLVTQDAVTGFLKNYEDETWFSQAFEAGELFKNYWRAIYCFEPILEETFCEWVRFDLRQGGISTDFVKEMGRSEQEIANQMLHHLTLGLKRHLAIVQMQRTLDDLASGQVAKSTDLDVAHPRSDQQEALEPPKPAEPPSSDDTVAQSHSENIAPLPTDDNLAQDKEAFDPFSLDYELLEKVVGEIQRVFAAKRWTHFLPILYKRLTANRETAGMSSGGIALELIKGSFLEKPTIFSLSINEGLKTVPLEAGEERRNLVEALFQDGLEVLSWLILLDVNWDADERKKVVAKDIGFQLSVPVSTPLGVEVVFAWLVNDKAKFQHGKNNQPTPVRGCTDSELIEKGLKDDEVLVYYEQKLRALLGLPADGEYDLDLILSEGYEFGEKYYMAIDYSHENHPLKDDTLKHKVREKYSKLPILFYGARDDNRIILRTQETQLFTVIYAYLRRSGEVLDKLGED